MNISGGVSAYRGVTVPVSVPTSVYATDQFIPADDLSGQTSIARLGQAQSWRSEVNPGQVTYVRVRIWNQGEARALTGLFRVAIYAHSGTFGSSSVPTGAPLTASAFYSMDTVAGSATDYYLPVTPWTPATLTYYTVVLEWYDAFIGVGGSVRMFSVNEDAPNNTHAGNGSIKSPTTSAWTAVSTDMAFAVLDDTPPMSTSWLHRHRLLLARGER